MTALEGLLFQQIADLCEQDDVSGRSGGWRSSFRLLHHGNELVRWLHNDKEDDGSSNDKADESTDDGPDVELEEGHKLIHLGLSAICSFLDHLDGLLTEFDLEIWVRTTAKHAEDGLNNTFSECGYDVAESGTDDDTRGEVNDIAFENKLFEFVDHDGVGGLRLGS